uniref:DNA polymerase III tau subunit domain-containing protein n=1 Tax=uncultured Thiotrichaceae bacterium TaxID=298394 RepID=A0A6S6UB86_9GAMM|nr:MAG: Unknown protein [uncultured Thiotrichaceae bacterium]
MTDNKVEPVEISVVDPTVDTLPAVPDVPIDDNEWHELLTKLKLGGMAKQLAEHCLVKQLTDDRLVLLLESSGVTLKTGLTEEALQEALHEHFGRSVAVEFDTVDVIAETPAQRRIRHGKELQQLAVQSIEDDLFVQQLKQDFGGMVLPGSVRPNKASE